MTSRPRPIARALQMLLMSGLLACARSEARQATPARGASISGAAVPDPGDPGYVPRRPCEGITPLPAQVLRGVSYVHDYAHGGTRGYGSAASQSSVAELVTLGANAVSLMPFGFMGSLRAEGVQLVGAMPAGETDERVVRAIGRAKRAGLSVLLKPHIWVRGGGYRGHIDPGSDGAWARWFESYGAFMLHYADMAQQQSVPILAVGVELSRAAQAHPARFRALIAAVRQRYDGKLVYCANWDEVATVPFWDALDYIGVQFFAPLADKPGASEGAQRAGGEQRLAALGELSRRLDKPVLLTEVGYKSVEGTAVAPYLWPERLKGEVRTSDQAQLRAYRAFFQALSQREWVHGLYIWKWFTDPSSKEEGPNGFSPRGKPAEQVLRCAYGKGGAAAL